MKKTITQIAAAHAVLGLAWLVLQFVLNWFDVGLNPELVQYANIAALLSGCIFLLITGKTFQSKAQRIIFLATFGLFIITVIMQALRLAEIIDVVGVMWMMAGALVVFVLGYLINFIIRREKTMVDVLKAFWVLTAACGFLIFRKVGIPYTVITLVVSYLSFFVLMGICLYQYYFRRK
ncbi:MAG: hypothetical protein ACRCYO_05700 [Bacteroidia bacterium]